MRYFLLLIALFPLMGLAGELTRGANVLEVANHASLNKKNFAVKVEGGIGPCVGWIYFEEENAPSPSAHNQAFAIALTALTAGKKVRIHNYSSDSCTGATFISISR
ncbi:hypothetical protein J2X32_003134 [Rheinheimera pacifica]|uniref:DUF5992 family protein n=1 Tax=Rheinheimera pacifica TaxID=173990 RepID=UPI00285F355F|nr:DUF5992 family protein [Rheinheimera pacifica]MDR6984490.1 hypothetical protein [Rheinheimera pacifica]